MIIILLTSLAFSQEERSVTYQKETQIDFDGLEVTGELYKPKGALIHEKSNVKFNPLIELRTDWNNEMSTSVTLVK